MRVIAERTCLKHDFLNIQSLFIISNDDWTKTRLPMILGYVRQKALAYITDMMSPLDRAAFWTGIGKKQRPVDHLRSLQFPMLAPKHSLRRVASAGSLSG